MKKIALFILGIIFIAGVTFSALQVYAGITNRVLLNNVKEMQDFAFFTATTTSAISTNTALGEYFKIAGARRVTLYFSRGGAVSPNTGISDFKIQVTPDGTNWYDYNNLRLNSITSGYPSLTASSTISAATSTNIAIMDTLGFYGIRCVVTETTDGEHTCRGTAEFGY